MPRWNPERKEYEPGHLSRDGRRLYLPEHPLASKNGHVSLNRLDAWQKRGYRAQHIEVLMGEKTQDYDTQFGGPGKPIADSKGYERWWWPDCPLAKGDQAIVYTHHVVYWQESGYDERILELLRSGVASVHHRNTVTNDNRPQNLDLRLRHPAGNNKDDWIHILRSEGYTVLPPEVMT